MNKTSDNQFEPVTDEILERFRGYWKVAGRSLVDELIQERREEARREQEELGKSGYPSKGSPRED